MCLRVCDLLNFNMLVGHRCFVVMFNNEFVLLLGLRLLPFKWIMPDPPFRMEFSESEL